jgi:hypothetical protein
MQQRGHKPVLMMSSREGGKRYAATANVASPQGIISL